MASLFRIPMLRSTTFRLWGRRLLFPAVVAAGWLYYPYATTGPTLCLFSLFLDVECLGCGLTRAVCYLARGAVSEAIGFNLLVVPIMILFAATSALAWRTMPR